MTSSTPGVARVIGLKVQRCDEAPAVLCRLHDTWLRSFNTDQPVADRVACYGFAGHSTHGAVQRLRDHLDADTPADHLVESVYAGAFDDVSDGGDEGGE